jgi:homoserine dehydrogenase
MKQVRIGLIGCGTVGGGFIRILQKHHDDFMQHAGVDLIIEAATTRTVSKLSALGIPDSVIVDSYEEIIANPDIDIVVELIGGTDIAADVVLAALGSGKNVVTANKALMASRGQEIFNAADENGVEIAFEASVGGGIPIIQPLKHALIGNEITTVLGIVNGTTNYMLTEMERGLDYDDVLKQAQELGYAEADPTADVDGFDAAAKIAILSSIAFNSRVQQDDVFTQGIRSIKPADLRHAAEMGYTIKLLAIGHKVDDKIDVRVHPTMIPKDHQLANVNGVYNAIYVTGDAVGDCMFFGEGAGAGAAASAVMGDVIEVARRVANNVEPIVGCTCTDNLAIRDIGELETKFYLRLLVADKPGVLAAISEIFCHHNVSIRSMVQPTAGGDGTAELIFVTHIAGDANFETALAEIQGLDCVVEIGTMIRIEGE